MVGDHEDGGSIPPSLTTLVPAGMMDPSREVDSQSTPGLFLQSNPVLVAQMEELRISNPTVAGSSPAGDILLALCSNGKDSDQCFHRSTFAVFESNRLPRQCIAELDL